MSGIRTSGRYILFTAEDHTAAVRLIELALAEDLGERGDVTSSALIPPSAMGEVRVVTRQPGVLAGSVLASEVAQRVDPSLVWQPLVADGQAIARGDLVARLSGPVRSLLAAERTILNFLTHLSGIASLTAEFVTRVSGTAAKVLDTRKTHPGYRRLEKYAVRCGGGHNHRLGLFDGVLIKDNHLAAWQALGAKSIATAVEHARRATHGELPIEVEVDTLAQLEDALSGRPELVLLDNMSLDQLAQAVALRNQRCPGVLLEASGGVNLQTVTAIAKSGVDRISIGALTHSAPALDLGFDW